MLAATGAAAMLVVAAASSTSASSTYLVEAAVCAHPTPLPDVTGARTDGATLVSFAIPSRTWLRLDEHGDTAAASTNTGCRPHADDSVVVVAADGTLRTATMDEISRAVTRFHTGDWRQPGVWHAVG